MTAALNVGRVLAAGPVIPVLVIDDEDAAVPLARALLAGGIKVLEITKAPRRTKAAVYSDTPLEAFYGNTGRIEGHGAVDPMYALLAIRYPHPPVFDRELPFRPESLKRASN